MNTDENINRIPINEGMKSRTNRALIATGAILASIWSTGDTLGIPLEYLDYISKAVTVIGLFTGYHFRNLTTKKVREWEDENIN